jgi:hypothetical protein
MTSSLLGLARELEDEIEAVNFRMLDKLLESSPLIAVFFCMYQKPK